MFENSIELSIIMGMYLFSMVTVACYKKDTSVSNFTWGGGVLIVALYTFCRMSNFLPQQLLATAMIVVWAIRLIGYVYIRYNGKDPRFATWKWQGFKALVVNTVWVFGQIIMIAVMSYPVVLINTYTVSHAVSFFDVCGLILWLFGFYWEAVSDWQLFVFMRNPAHKGQVMRTGLWRYSRHPNYFGESLMWHGLFFVALSIPGGWTALIAPVTITFLLVFVTGIPWIEKTLERNSEYQEYKQQTSMFIPWFVKK